MTLVLVVLKINLLKAVIYSIHTQNKIQTTYAVKGCARRLTGSSYHEQNQEWHNEKRKHQFQIDRYRDQEKQCHFKSPLHSRTVFRHQLPAGWWRQSTHQDRHEKHLEHHVQEICFQYEKRNQNFGCCSSLRGGCTLRPRNRMKIV
jgi:hypothetical protein